MPAQPIVSPFQFANRARSAPDSFKSDIIETVDGAAGGWMGEWVGVMWASICVLGRYGGGPAEFQPVRFRTAVTRMQNRQACSETK